MNLKGHIDSWYAASANQNPEFPGLQGSIKSDVCIVGGGYTGLSTALHLRERGYSVVLLEAERIGWGASGRNGGHVGVGQRSDQDSLEAMVGIEQARRLWQLGVEAVDLVCELIEQHDIQCDLKRGNLHVAAKPGHVDEMKAYCEKLQRDYDYHDCRFVDRAELEQLTSSRRYFAGELDTGARHLHPLNYTLGLASAASDSGARIFEQSRVTGFSRGRRIEVNTPSGIVDTEYLVLACNAHLEKLCKPAAIQIMPINNYMLATEPLGEETARRIIRDDSSMSDSLFVLNYWKLSADNRLLFGGGESYSRRYPRDIKSFVRKHMLKTYPELAQARIEYGWGGTLAITMNRMPSFGRIKGNILYAQGYSGHGVPIATLAGKLLAEAISGTAERFDLMARVPTPTFPGGTLLRWPGLVAGMSWYALKDRL